MPTYNERENLKTLVERIFSAADVEVVVVDDGSPDGTGELADRLAEAYNMNVLHRTGKLGLASAMLAGLEASSNEVVGFIDADLSHPPELMPKLLKEVDDGADVVFASRYAGAGGVEHWPWHRRMISWGATMLARPLAPVKDPMSGYFFIKKNVVGGVELDPIGYKLGLEILVKGHYSKVVEVPFMFRDRAAGKTKLNLSEHFNYLKHLMRLYAYRVGLK